MELGKLNKKKLKWIVLIPVLVIGTVIYSVLNNSDDVSVAENGLPASNAESGNQAEPLLEEDKLMDIYVDVGGAIVNPGVVSIKSGARIFEAVDAAGGITEEADTRYMNMAKMCEDGQKIYIPTADEVKAEKESGSGSGSSAAAGVTVENYAAATISGGNSAGKVNINTAGSDELQSLSGIGPSMASRIIEYREANGKFLSVEDVLNVSGIGEKTLAKFKDNICV